jgi:ankyrin repeat protein
LGDTSSDEGIESVGGADGASVAALVLQPSDNAGISASFDNSETAAAVASLGANESGGAGSGDGSVAEQNKDDDENSGASSHLDSSGNTVASPESSWNAVSDRFVANGDVEGGAAVDPTIESTDQQYEKALSEARELEDDEVVELLLLIDPLQRSAAQGTEAFWFASFNGNTGRVKMLLLDPHVDPTAKNNAAIRLASLAGNTETTKLLLSDIRVDPVAVDNQAIRVAGIYGHTEITRLLLLDPRVNPAAGNNYAINMASQNGHHETVKLLLSDARVSPAANNDYAIGMASEYGHHKAVKVLLSDSRVDPAAGNDYAIRMASVYGHHETVKLFLSDPRVDPAARNDYAICMASVHGHHETVKLFLSDPRVDPAADNDCAIRITSQNGHTNTIKLLLSDPRVDPAADNDCAIRIASHNGHTNTVKLLLLDPRVDPAADNDYAIRIASKRGHTNTVKLLLSDPRVNPAAGNDYAIGMASESGHYETLKVLLSDPRVDPAADNNIALRTAAEKGFPETMSALLQDPRVIRTYQQSNECVLVAIQNGFVDVVSLLLSRFSLPDENISELVGICAEHGRSEILKIILHKLDLQEDDPALSTLILESLQKSLNFRNHEFVLDLLTQPKNCAIGKAVGSVLEGDEALLAQLACMHVDVLRILRSKYESDVVGEIRSSLMSSACRMGSVDVVRELLDNHQDKINSWTVDDFNSAALHGNVPVLQLLSLSRYGGCKKLVENPPLKRICARRVLNEMRVKSSVALMWCIKKKTTHKIRAKLLDVLRDLITDGLLRYDMK